MAMQENLAKRTKFKVILNGMPLGFSKVSNISATMEFETVAEGGLNDRWISWCWNMESPAGNCCGPR